MGSCGRAAGPQVEREERQLGPGTGSGTFGERSSASHVIAVTRQDNGEVTEEIVHQDWVEPVERDGAASEGVPSEGRETFPAGGEGPGRRGAPAPALARPERLVSAEPAPVTEEPSNPGSAPGTLPPVADPATGRRRAR